MQEEKREQAVRANDSGDEMEIDLAVLFRDFFKIFSKLWWLVLILIAAGIAAYGAFSFVRYTPMYRCQATFTVATGDEDSGTYNFYYSQNTADQLSRTFPYILESSYFRSVLLETLGTETLNGSLSAETVENSNMVTMTVTSSSAGDAYEILNAALTVYPETARFVLGTIQFHLIDDPQAPTAPYNRPVPRQIVLRGGLAGAVLGIVILGILALFRKTAKTPDEMRRFTSLKCLAAVPAVKFKARRNQSGNRISVLNKRLSYGYVESIRALQIRLEHAMQKDGGKVILVTSTAAGEGKSTIAVNLAEMLATKGKKVLLIDGDLRKQQDGKMLGCTDSVGLGDIFRKDHPAKAVIRRLSEENFWFLGGTHTVSKPAQILSHPQLGAFINAMKKKVDYVILDTPPCGIFQDAVLLAEHADAILYVVKYDFVPQPKIREGLSFLRDASSKFAGYVFNAYPQNMNDYGYGRYGYGKYGYGRYGYGKYGGRYGSRYGGDNQEDIEVDTEDGR